MHNHWSCSNIANKIRGTVKPSALEIGKWHEWDEDAKTNHPVRYWLAEEGLDKLQTFISWPTDRINDVRYWLNNRFVAHTHSLTSKLKRGQYHELDTRILHCLFDELVNFVEVELAWSHVCWDEEARKKYKLPFWRKQWYTRWFLEWRNRQAGLDHLAWEMSLMTDDGKSTYQAKRAKEVYELYFWWTTVRPSRLDPMEASGWIVYCDKMSKKYGPGLVSWNDRTKDERKESNVLHKKLDKMEKDYDKEDDEMLIKLIKIRKGLWT